MNTKFGLALLEFTVTRAEITHEGPTIPFTAQVGRLSDWEEIPTS